MMNSISNFGCMSWLECICKKVDDICREIDEIMTQNANVRNQVHTTTGETDRKKLAVAKEKLAVAKRKLAVSRGKLAVAKKKLAVAKKKLPQEDKLAVSFRRANDFEIPVRKTLEESKQDQKPYLDCDRDFSHLSKSAQDILKNYKAGYAEDMEWEIVNLDGEHTY